MIFNDEFSLAKKKLIEADKVLVIGHLRPDGDALSSCCAVLEIAKYFSKDAWGFCSGPLPLNFDFLPNFYKLDSSVEDLKEKLGLSADDWLEFFDLIFVLDCGSLSRTALAKEIKKSRSKKRPFIIEIDHHPSVDHYSDLEIRNSQSSSATEIIYDFCKFLKIPLNRPLAECLLAGIVSDTGNFFYPNASSKSLQAASHLLSAGANLPKISKQVMAGSQKKPTFRLWALAMERLEINFDYNLAFSVLRREDIERVGADQEEASETLSSIAGFLSNLAGVKVTLLLHETARGMLKGHLRSSQPMTDVSRLARLLGGGGHPQASGFALAGKLKRIKFGWRIE